jgi:hypothetical protein
MLWNILPTGALTILWEGGKPTWIAMVLLLFFALSYYAGGGSMIFIKERNVSWKY